MNQGPLGEVLSSYASYRRNSGGAAIPANPDPAYRYLRVETAEGPAALLALGYLDPDPLGDVEVWYSSAREVIKTRNGRIVGTAGLATNWRSSAFPAQIPVWQAIGPAGANFVRVRDEMPGYRDAIEDQMRTTRLPGMPPIALPPAVDPLWASTLTWYREDTVSSTWAPLPPAWFGMEVQQGKASIVYSYQCLSASLCLSLFRWPLQVALR